MKRLLTFCITLTIMLGVTGFYAYADYEPVKAEVAVEISHGGTAVIIPEVNCPIPEKTEIKLSDGEIGKFDIYFTDVGIYSYTVKEMPDDRKLKFDKTVYDIKIYVTDEDGELVSTVIAYKGENKYSSHSGIKGAVRFGPERLVFLNEPPDGGTEDDSVTEDEDDDKDSDKEKTDSQTRNRNPKTGDDSKMEMYFLFAMIASAGLFALSVVYMIDTQKMIKNRKRESEKTE